MANPKIYTGDGWEIRCGRWQDSAPESVDVVISDPPYNAHTHAGGRRIVSRGGVKTIERVQFSFPPVNPAHVAPPLLAISKRWVVCFCAIEQVGHYADAAGDGWVRGGVWRRINQQPQLSGDRPAVFGDALAIMHRKGRKHWNRRGGHAFWAYRYEIQTPTRDKCHECGKPLDLMLALVSDFSDPDELVWDPYCGSGTTGVACLRLGRRFLGHEMQPHYAQVAAERLAAEERGLTLQEARRGQMSILDALKGHG